MSYISINKVPRRIPGQLFSSNPWSLGAYSNWTIIKEMLDVPILYIIGTFAPTIMNVVLYYFDHYIASQLSQYKEFSIRKTSSYHYELLLLGFLTILCGLIGIPPSNGDFLISNAHDELNYFKT